MSEFRQVTPDFAVAAQLAPAALARAAAAGFAIVVNNRPEAEDSNQPRDQDMRAAAEAAGLQYRTLPFRGVPPPAAVAATATLLEEAQGPVLAYCRSGKRSIMAWAMAQALAGARQPEEIIALAAKAGYDLTGVRGTLDALAPNF